MKVLSSKLKAIILPFLLSGCIGTDLLDDETRPEILEIEVPGEDVVSLLVGQNQQLSFNYLNEFGVAEDIDPTWTVEDASIATVSTNGTVLALSRGQTHVMIMVEGVMSAPVPINVSETANDVNKVLIESPKEVLQVGETIQLVATAWNIAGELVENTQATWQVDNENIAEVNDEGSLTAISNGEILVTATINGVESEPFLIQIGSSSRTASFEGRSGYNAVGMATLFVAENGDIMLELSDDFDTDFALGTFIYLSNSTAGSATRSAGLELSEIRSGGAALFNVSEIDADVTLSTYRYVIVLCKPASITFGVADLNP
ncbi:MAG: Ig-like domain-containing protein [Cytophagales bacterium]|nr:Ig-like domain-containing protein [Cytophagales bacterium]